MTNQSPYIDVEARAVEGRSANGSDPEMTYVNGFYISYVPVAAVDGGGFSGSGWMLNHSGNPLTFNGLTNEKAILDKIQANGGNLNSEFANWGALEDITKILDFQSYLANNYPSCITRMTT